MAERLFDLPETKGQFQLKGIVSGTNSSRFFTEKDINSTGGKTRSMRTLNFGVSYNFDNKLYVNMVGIEQDNVYFYNKDNKKTEKVSWGNRLNFNRDGYRLIGNNIGVKKITDPNTGEKVNDKKLMTDYDTCLEVYSNLKDDSSVFVRGDLSFRSYVNRNGDKISSVNLVPKQISLCADIDFTDEKYVQTNDFSQVIIYTGVSKETDDSGKQTGRFIISAKIVTYSTVEDAEFIIENSKLANMFRKNLRPYNSIKVSGHMVAEPVVEEIADEDEWGESDAMERIAKPVKREFIITGAKGSTIDRDTYTEENINSAIAAVNRSKKAEKDFNSDNDEDNNENWGDTTLDNDDDDFNWED